MSLGTLLERLASEPQTQLRYFGSPQLHSFGDIDAGVFLSRDRRLWR